VPSLSSPSSRRWLAIVVLLLPAIVLPLWVPLFDRRDPEIGGWPFFFWFQFVLIGVAVVLTAIASVLAARVHRIDRERHGLAAGPVSED
jgi:hypothetical protein